MPHSVDMSIFDIFDSAVCSYSRTWPAVFDRAAGSRIHAINGRTYLDFFAGAGSLNYGHNHPALKEALIDYLIADGIINSMDMYTRARFEFLEAFSSIILEPRDLKYKVMLPGPAGTNAVEAALKLARKVKGRLPIVAFRNAFHGATLGSLAVTDPHLMPNSPSTLVPGSTVTIPYGSLMDRGTTNADDFEQAIAKAAGLYGRPAAAIVEVVQGEGGINVASDHALRQLATFCRQHDMLLIIDDIQMGCGRTGPFFSFESAAIRPDIVTVSKSISGSGVPMALTLFNESIDQWSPAEHNGTFRGNNLAFVSGTTAVKTFWADDNLMRSTSALGSIVESGLSAICAERPGAFAVRGRGLVWGLACCEPLHAAKICRQAFELGLLVERAGAAGEVVKLLPPLTSAAADIEEGLDILGRTVRET